MADTDTDCCASFWLPPDFLTDDDFLTDMKPISKPSPTTVAGFAPPRNRLAPPTPTPTPNNSGGYYDLFASPPALNSPVESGTSSAEAEEENNVDRDEFIAELTRHFARSSSLIDRTAATAPHPHPHPQEKSWGVLATSPQSTLSGFATWSNRETPYLRRSLTCPTRPVEELIYAAAAGEVARMKMRAQAEVEAHQIMKHQQQRHAHLQEQKSRGLLAAGCRCNLAPYTVAAPAPHSTGCFIHSRPVAQIQQLKQHQNTMRNNGGCGVGLFDNGRCGGATGGFAWPVPPHNHQFHHHHHHHGLQPRPQPVSGEYLGRPAAFVGGSVPAAVPKKKSVGTGVFLPRQFVGNNNNNNHAGCEPPRRKRGCSPVSVPATAASRMPSQSLNLKFEQVDTNNGGPHFQSHPTLIPNHDAVQLARRNAFIKTKTTTTMTTSPRPEKPVVMTEQQQQKHGVLPQDWTY